REPKPPDTTTSAGAATPHRPQRLRSRPKAGFELARTLIAQRAARRAGAMQRSRAVPAEGRAFKARPPRALQSRRERRVEGGGGRFHLVEGSDEFQGLGGALEAVHAGVLPFDGDRSAVADGVEGAEAVLPGDVAAAGGDEVPAAPQVGPRKVGREAPAAAVAGADLGVLAVDVVDAVAEVEQEADRVEVLPDEVGGVEVEAERGPVPDRLQRPHGRPVVVGDLAGVDLVREPDADLVEDVEDRVPPFGEV